MKIKTFGLLFGSVLFFGSLFSPPPPGLSAEAWYTASVALLMAVWWITEAIPVYATGLLPIVFFPLLGVSTIDETASPYASPLVFLFLGGFMIALAMQRWGLHKRISINLLFFVGTRPSNLVGGIMLTTAFLSMWVSNTATAMMMLPIALSILSILDSIDEKEFLRLSTALILAVAYGANVGGLSTLVGTPTNALLAAYFDEIYGVTISFLDWILLGLPISVMLLLVIWLTLTKVLFPMKNLNLQNVEGYLKDSKESLGNLSQGEIITACAFLVCAGLWILRPLIDSWITWLKLTDAGIAITVALLLFIIPSGKSKEPILNWEWASRLPWGVVFLFGGGLSLASSMSSSGLSEWIGQGISEWGELNIVIVLLIIISLVVFLTEITSNTATMATLLPVISAIAVSMSEEPLLFCVPATLAASCAFMLPSATPPNAIVFGSGYITIPQMARAGILLNIISIFTLLFATFLIVTRVLKLA